MVVYIWPLLRSISRRDLRNQAAAKVQSVLRGWLHRMNTQKEKDLHHVTFTMSQMRQDLWESRTAGTAATTLQAVVRGFMERLRHKKRLEEEERRKLEEAQ